LKDYIRTVLQKKKDGINVAQVRDVSGSCKLWKYQGWLRNCQLVQNGPTQLS